MSVKDTHSHCQATFSDDSFDFYSILDFTSAVRYNNRRKVNTEAKNRAGRRPERGATGVDEIDLKIVHLLYANGRISHEQLAREVHLSRPAIHERVKRLEEEGVLGGYQALVNWGEVGLPITAFIWVRTVGVKSREPGKAIMGLTSETALVEECHRVAGEWCLLVKARAASPLALESLLDEIRDLPGVDVTMTTIVLSTLTEDVRLQPDAPPPGEHTRLSLAREAS